MAQMDEPVRWRIGRWRLALVLFLTFLGGAVFLRFGPDLVLNRWVRPRVVEAFRAAHPGASLQMGRVHVDWWRDTVHCDELSVANADGTCAVQSLALAGVPWISAAFGERRPAALLQQARVQANGVTLNFPRTGYRLRCRQIQGGVAGSAVSIRDLELRPSMTDQEFFAARPYRRARLDLRVGEVSGTGVELLELLAGKAYVAQSLQLRSPILEVHINRDKPRNPNPPNVRMPQAWLAAAKAPLQVDRLEVLNGRIVVTETVAAQAEPGILTFDAVQIAVRQISNRLEARAPILLSGEALLMNRGRLKGSMELPAGNPDWTFRYTASLGPMDLRVLNSFLQVAGHSRINAGAVQSASCEITVRAGHARGRFDGAYQGLDVTVLDRQTGEDSGVLNWLKTAFANNIALRTSNPHRSGETKVGLVDYTRKPADRFLPFVWLGIRSGMFDVLGLAPYFRNKPPK